MRGSAARGLIALGIIVAAIAAVLVSVDVPVRGPIGQRRYHPHAATSVRAEYRVGIGDLRLDLRDVAWTTGTHTVHVRVGIGEATVFVPADVTVVVVGHAGIGDVRLLDRRVSGLGVDDRTTAAAVTGAPIVHIDARTGIGEVHVVQEGSLR